MQEEAKKAIQTELTAIEAETVIQNYIETLRSVSSGQPDSWYLQQAKNQPSIKELLITCGKLHEVKLYHDWDSPSFTYKEENYLFSVWVDRSLPENELKTLEELYSELLIQRGLAPNEYKSMGKGFIVLDSKFNSKFNFIKSDLQSICIDGFKWVCEENKRKKKVYMFQREIIDDNKKPWKKYKGYEVLNAFKEDILTGNLKDMVKLGVTR